VPLECDGTDAAVSFTLGQGEAAVFALDRLEDAAIPLPCPLEAAEGQFTATVTFWRGWLAQSRHRGRWREMVHRSALTLKLLTYAPTGAMVAAPTASLPKQIGGERNWDYRHLWVRDAAFCVYSLLRLGFTGEAESFVRFLLERIDHRAVGPSGPLQIMYGIDSRTQVPENSPTWRATVARRRCASATPRPTSSNSTSTARSNAPCASPGAGACPPT
jgi:hypothetical protein